MKKLVAIPIALVASLVTVVAVSCQSSSFQHTQAAPAPGSTPSAKGLSRDEEVQTVVLERMLKAWGGIAQADGERPQTNYLAVSDTLHLFGGEQAPRDPSANVLSALGMWQAKKFSDCEARKYERIAVTDRDRGFPGRILWVGPIKWVDANTAETSAGVWENLKFAPGEMLRARWEDGQWHITATGGWDT